WMPRWACVKQDKITSVLSPSRLGEIGSRLHFQNTCFILEGWRMRCPKCDRVIPSKARFCPYCGSATQKQTPPAKATSAAPRPRGTSARAAPTQTSSGLSIGGILLAVFAVGVIFVLLRSFVGESQNKSTILPTATPDYLTTQVLNDRDLSEYT